MWQQELKVMEEAKLVQELEKNRDRATVALQAAEAEMEMLEQWQQLGLQDELWSVEDQLQYAQTQLA